MRKTLTFFGAVLLASALWAQSPEKMSYQAIIRNSNDALVTNTQIGMEINIRQGSLSGTVVYTETQTPTTNANGLVSIEIGNGAGFTAIDWFAGPYFVETKTSIVPPLATYTITGVSQILSVPYALHAKTAESVTGENTETDPIFGASLASGITSADTTYWNTKQERLSAGKNITIEGNIISSADCGSFTHYIGELFGGGIVVAVWKVSGVEHGLIASLTDVNTSARYSSITDARIGVAAQSLYDGQSNTIAIVAQGDVSGAAFLCDNYSSGGFTDWYLPASWELTQCFNAAFIVNTILGAANGFQYASYWSSTEYDDTGAWYKYFYFDDTTTGGKNSSSSVRAVRRF